MHFLVKDPHAPPRDYAAGGINPRGGDFFITETYLTPFVSNFFHLTNVCFDPVDIPAVHGAPGDDPKVIFFITDAYATTFIRNLC